MGGEKHGRGNSRTALAGMKSSGVNDFHIGRRLMLTFAVLITVILGGNGLVIWQFYIAHARTNRLTGANQHATGSGAQVMPLDRNATQVVKAATVAPAE